MQPIQVRPYPLARAFDSIEAAVRHALSHPRLPDARRDAARLQGAVFVDACWTLFEWVVRFDRGLSLRLWSDPAEVRWCLTESSAVEVAGEFQRVGAAPVTLDFSDTVRLWTMDGSTLVAKRRGALFRGLFFNEFGLFLYLHGHLILHFGRAERIEDGRSILTVCEDD
jgi:hypothetical protein